MLDKKQLHDELTEKVKAQIFEKQLNERLQAHLEKKIADGNKTYAEKVDRSKYAVDVDHTPSQFEIRGDDPVLKPLKWASAYTDAAFYFDHPTVQQEKQIKKKFQSRYDDLFAQGYRPALQNRSTLVEWVCTQHQAFLTEKGKEPTNNCKNVQEMIQTFGPDYSTVRAKLGWSKHMY